MSLDGEGNDDGNGSSKNSGLPSSTLGPQNGNTKIKKISNYAEIVENKEKKKKT